MSAFGQPYRARYCARCQHPMREAVHEGVSMLACPRCASGLVAGEGLRKLLRDRTDPATWLASGVARQEGTGHLFCPDHGGLTTMQRWMLRHEEHEIEVDACPTCAGVWLDSGEGHALEQMADALHAAENVRLSEVLDAAELARQQQAEDVLVHAVAQRRGFAIPGTISIGALLLGIHVAMLASPTIYAAAYGLAFVPAKVTEGAGALALLSGAFVHADPFHLLFNGIFFLGFASIIERTTGTRWLLAVFILGAVAGNVAHILYEPDGRIPLVGASAAVYALIAATLVNAPRVRIVQKGPRTLGMVLAVLCIAAYEVAKMHVGARYVAYHAHVGGLAAGVLMAVAMRIFDPPRPIVLRHEEALVAGSRLRTSKFLDLISDWPLVSIPAIGALIMAAYFFLVHLTHDVVPELDCELVRRQLPDEWASVVVALEAEEIEDGSDAEVVLARAREYAKPDGSLWSRDVSLYMLLPADLPPEIVTEIERLEDLARAFARNCD